MFDRYTEAARRVIFFARYEASQMASGWIEPVHLLLGLLREDPVLKRHLAAAEMEEIRRQVVENWQGKGPKLSTSVDLPLSREATHVLTFAAEESEKLGQQIIVPGHLVLGLMRVGGEPGRLLAAHLQYEDYRKVVAGSGQESKTAHEPVLTDLKPEGPLRTTVVRLSALIDRASAEMAAYTEADSLRTVKRWNWTRREALGHLVDWATTHHQWFARALTDSRLAASMYPGPAWVKAENYGDWDWPDLLDTWMAVNRLVARVMTQVPEPKLTTSCKIGLEPTVTLEELATRYVSYVEDGVAVILARSK